MWPANAMGALGGQELELRNMELEKINTLDTKINVLIIFDPSPHRGDCVIHWQLTHGCSA